MAERDDGMKTCGDTIPENPESEDKSSGDNTSYDRRWQEMYLRLKAFKDKHGHCKVPNRYEEDQALGYWVSTQRRQYRILSDEDGKSAPLTMERAKLLMDLGFEWSAKDPSHKSWDGRYEELCDFVKKNGHALVPMGYKENNRLATWVSAQRQEYKLLKEGRSSRLTEEKIKRLDAIGFAWKMQRGRKKRKVESLSNAAAGARSELQANDSVAQQTTGPISKARKTQSNASRKTTGEETSVPSVPVAARAATGLPEEPFSQQGSAAASFYASSRLQTPLTSLGSDSLLSIRAANGFGPVALDESSQGRESFIRSHLSTLLKRRPAASASGLHLGHPFDAFSSGNFALEEHLKKQILAQQILDRGQNVGNLIGGLSNRLFFPSVANTTNTAASLPSLACLQQPVEQQAAASQHAQEYYAMALRQAQAFREENAAAAALVARANNHRTTGPPDGYPQGEHHGDR